MKFIISVNLEDIEHWNIGQLFVVDSVNRSTGEVKVDSEFDKYSLPDSYVRWLKELESK